MFKDTSAGTPVCFKLDTTDPEDEDICQIAEDLSSGSGLVIGLILAILAAIAVGIVVYCFCCKDDDDSFQKQNWVAIWIG